MPPDTRYARVGDVHVAYQVFGDGPRDLVVVFGYTSHLDVLWECAELAETYERLADFARVIIFDKRGMGLSDPLPQPPTLEERADDIRAVMDAAGSERAVIFAQSQGSEAALLFAATHPDRVESLVLYGAAARTTQAPDYPWAAPLDDVLQANAELIAPAWGTGATLETFGPSVADSPAHRAWMGKLERSSASPGMVYRLWLMALDTDVRALLPSVQVPTLVIHRTCDLAVSVHGARWLATQIPGAKYVEIPGADHQYFWDAGDAVLDEVTEFVTGERPVRGFDRVLATVMFTDIVGSTGLAVALGDERWKRLLDDHDRIARSVIAAAGGSLIKTTGDGSLATFDGPGRAVRAAQHLRRDLSARDLTIRCGIHTGEVEIRGDDIGGVAVHIAARIAAMAGDGEVLVSSTVKDLVAGSGIVFEPRGEHQLKGIPDSWRLFAAS